MAAYSVGDIVRLKDSQVSGVIEQILDDGRLVLTLDVGGSATVNTEDLAGSMDEERDRNGKFVAGHSFIPQNIENRQKKYNARQLRMAMTQKLGPILEHIDTLIMNIDDPSKQVDALSKMCKYVMPTLSSIDYTENTPRALSEEEQLARFKHIHEQKKAGQ